MIDNSDSMMAIRAEIQALEFRLQQAMQPGGTIDPREAVFEVFKILVDLLKITTNHEKDITNFANKNGGK